MSFRFHFSSDIFHARTDNRKLTQQQVADAVYISLRAYQKIEKGDHIPCTEIFLRLVFFFDLNIENYREEVLNRVPVYSF